MAVPIQSLPNGQIKWSDGRVTSAMSSPTAGHVSTDPAKARLTGVLGAATTAAPLSGPSNQGVGNVAQTNSLSSLQNAELSGLNTQYDQNMEDWSSQLDYAGQQKDLAVSGVTNAQNALVSDVENQKLGVEGQKLSAIDEAGQTARNTQRSNRNVLRSLGILNSTYAADKLQEPINNFDKGRVSIVQQATERIGQLDSFINNKKSEFVDQIKSINQQFAQMTDQISRDIRFGDRQRADAIKAINAAYSAKKEELINGTKGILDAAEKAKQQFSSSLIQNAVNSDVSLLSDPTKLKSMIEGAGMAANQVYTPQQVGLVEDPRKKLSGSGVY